MKQQKLLFNYLLLKYKKYTKKLVRFELTGNNIHRQKILKKHINRLYCKLNSLYTSIKLSKLAGISMLSASMMLIAPKIDAQTNFATQQINAFGLSTVANGLSTPTFADLDNDGDMDLLTGEYGGTFYYYENTGTSNTPSFGAGINNPFGMDSVLNAYETSPSFVDMDGDGDFDILAGGYYGSFLYFENTGNATNPIFGSAIRNPFGIDSLQYNYSSSVSFVDIDDDGDLDFFSGDYYGDFHYFEKTGTTTPSFATSILNPFNLTSLTENNSTPGFVDLDEDGDMDLLSGAQDGNFYFYENNGSANTAAFDTAVINPFGITGLNNNSKPTFVDIDGDGDMDIMSGSSNGDFVFYENISTPVVDVIIELSSNTLTVNESDLSFTIPLNYQSGTSNPSHTVDLILVSGDATDVDNFSTMTATFNSTSESFTINITDDAIVETNETLSFALANASSGLIIGSDSTFTVTIEDNDASAISEIGLEDLNIYPNPSSDQIQISVNTNKRQEYSFIIMDLIGNTVLSQKHTLNEGKNTLTFDLGTLAAGNYFLNIKTADGNHTEKILIK